MLRVTYVTDLRVRAGWRTRFTRLALLFLVPVLVALAACSESAPTGGVVTPVVTISADGSGDQAKLRFHVRAQPAPATDLTVSVTITADPCDVPQDTESVTIRAGEDQAVLTVTTSLAAGAGDCTVTATITDGEGYRVGDVPSASAPAVPGQPVVTVAGGASPVPEGTPASWTLSATPAPTAPLTVNLTWSEDGDFVTGTRQQTVTIPVSGTETVSVDTDDDDIDETDGTVTLRVDAGSGYSVGTPSTATITVVDDDGVGLPAVTVVADDASIVEGIPASWTLSATPAPASALTVNLTLEENGDFVTGTRPQTETIPASGTATVTVTTANDGTDEPHGSVVLQVDAGSGYTVGSPDAATISVIDNDGIDLPTVTVRVSGRTSVGEGETASWEVRAVPAPAAALTVNLDLTQSGDFLPVTGRQTVTIPVSGTATVTVTTEDDGTDEPNGSVTLSVAAGNGYTVGTQQRSASVTVTDNDLETSRVLTLHTMLTEVNEGENVPYEIRTTLAFETNANIAVYIRDTDKPDFEANRVFIAGLTVQVMFETASSLVGVQVDRTLSVELLDGAGYTVGSPGSFTVDVNDNGNN